MWDQGEIGGSSGCDQIASILGEVREYLHKRQGYGRGMRMKLSSKCISERKWMLDVMRTKAGMA